MNKTFAIICLCPLLLFSGIILHANKKGFDNVSIKKDTKQSTPLIWSFNTNDIVFSIDISFDGNYIIIASGYNITLIDKDKNIIWATNTEELLGLASLIRSVAISSDGNYIVVGTEGPGMPVLFFHKSSPTPLWSWPASWVHVNSVSISSNGEYVTPVGEDGVGNGYILEFEGIGGDGNPIWYYSTPGIIRADDISSDGRYIIAGGDCIDINKTNHDNIYFFDRDSPGHLLWSNSTHNGFFKNITSVSITERGDKVVVGTADTSGHAQVYLFQGANGSGTPIWNYSEIGNKNFSSVAISKNGDYIFVGSSAGNSSGVYLFSSDGHGKPEWHSYTMPVRSVDIDDNGDYMAASTGWGSGGEVLFFERSLTNNTHIWKQLTGDYLGDHTIDVTTNGSYVVTGSIDGNVYFFKGKTFQITPHDSAVDIDNYKFCMTVGLILIICGLLAVLITTILKKKRRRLG